MPSGIPVRSMGSFQEIPSFFEPTVPPPTMPILLTQTEIGKMRSSDKLLGQEEVGQRSVQQERSKVPFTPYPSRINKQINTDDSDSDSLSDLSSLSDSDLDDDDLISKPEGEAGRPGQGGYNLEEALSWPKKEYRQLKVTLLLHSLTFLTFLNRNMSKNLSRNTLYQTRTFLLNLLRLLPLLMLWYVLHARI